MFENVGNRIKIWAKCILVICLITNLAGIMTTLAILIDIRFNGFLIFLIGLVEATIGVILAQFICYLVYGFGVIVSNHERQEKEYINEYTKIPSESSGVYNGSLFKNMDNERAPKGQPAAGEWKCSKCGKINQNYVGTCGCGEVKSHTNSNTTDSKWTVCPKCGQKQDPARSSCFKCGATFE